MKNKISIILLLISFICLFSNYIFAYNLGLVLSADKTDVKIGDTVTVTLTLSQGMQAADFALNYDNNLLEFESTSLGEIFYKIEPGKIVCSWFDTKDTTTFTYKFLVKSAGTAQFSTTTENFYDGNLQSASSYNEGKLNLSLLSSSNTISNTITQINNEENKNQIPNNNTPRRCNSNKCRKS